MKNLKDFLNSNSVFFPRSPLILLHRDSLCYRALTGEHTYCINISDVFLFYLYLYSSSGYFLQRCISVSVLGDEQEAEQLYARKPLLQFSSVTSCFHNNKWIVGRTCCCRSSDAESSDTLHLDQHWSNHSGAIRGALKSRERGKLKATNQEETECHLLPPQHLTRLWKSDQFEQ